jgi:hypothetical protein
MTIGIGGAGSKLALKLDPKATIVNVSQNEMDKLPAERRLLAVVHAAEGQLRGSRKDPTIGRHAFQSIGDELLHLCRGQTLFSSTGGGTGNGISARLLEEIARLETVALEDRTLFVLVLPYAKLEPAEYVLNTTAFLQGPLSEAIDSGNTGNIVLLSNQVKFESKLTEDEFNGMLISSLRQFLAVPEKNAELELLDGHIDYEDFRLYQGRPYFNHFTGFEIDKRYAFGTLLQKNLNPLLLAPENAIEALFLLEVPEDGDPRDFYDILEYFAGINVTPMYSVVRNARRKKPFVTVSQLYLRKPAELVEDFNRISEEHAKTRVRKSLEQHVQLPKLEVNLESEVKRVGKQRGSSDSDILVILRRLGKL